MAKKYYAVRNGRKTGIFHTWDECKRYVTGYSGAAYKGFDNEEDAAAFLNIGTNENIVCGVQNGNKAVAYVDGSYNAKNKHFSYGAVIMYKNEEYKLSQEYDDSSLAGMRNVAGEIKGAEAAMRFCIENDIREIDIYHDYEGVAKWCRGEWKANKEGTQSYVHFFRQVSEKVKVNFIKVKGHSGDKYNDMADSLAKSALGI